MLFWIIAVVVLILDRAAKYLVTAYIDLGQTIPIIQDFFHITYVKNPGAAFGILTDKKWFFIIITIIVLFVLVYLARTLGGQNKVMNAVLGLLAGGAIGNLVDRINSGLVIDYLDFRGIWPYIFNVADSAIVVGVILLSWQLLRNEKK